jgi:hypothetical protein
MLSAPMKTTQKPSDKEIIICSTFNMLNSSLTNRKVYIPFKARLLPSKRPALRYEMLEDYTISISTAKVTGCL